MEDSRLPAPGHPIRWHALPSKGALQPHLHPTRRARFPAVRVTRRNMQATKETWERASKQQTEPYLVLRDSLCSCEAYAMGSKLWNTCPLVPCLHDHMPSCPQGH